MNRKPTIAFRQLSDLADMFGEGENIEPNDADFEMDEFRKRWYSIRVTAFNGYMVYGTNTPEKDARNANNLIKKMGWKLQATASEIRKVMTIQYTG